MKNITKYEDFKKLKLIKEMHRSASHTGIVGSINDPFINVSGNFAGADKTLVGGAIINLFRFIKRKGYQVYFQRTLKKKLRKGYIKGLLKYCLHSNKVLPKAKIYYDIYLMMDINKNKIEDINKILVKFVNEDKSISLDIGSIVKTKDDKMVEVDGYYMLSDYIKVILIQGGKVIKIDADQDVKELEKEIKDLEQKKLEEELSKSDIEKLYDIIDKSEINKDNLKKHLIEVTESITILEEGLNEINTTIKNLSGKKDTIKLESDRDIYKKDLEDLKKVQVLIEEKLEGGTPSPTSPTPQQPKPVVVKEQPKQEQGKSKSTVTTENFNNMEYIMEMSSAEMSFNTKPVEKGEKDEKDKKTLTQETINKLKLMSENDIKLDDPEFKKQFKQEDKKECTAMVLQYSSDIIKVQIEAERYYKSDDGKVERKLLNSWLRMIQNVKKEFEDFMFVDALDPIKLTEKLHSSDNKEYEKLLNEPGGPKDNSNTLDNLSKIDTNKKLKNLLIIKNKIGEIINTIGIIKFSIEGKKIHYFLIKPEPNISIGDTNRNLYRVISPVKFKDLLEIKDDLYEKYIDFKFETAPEYLPTNLPYVETVNKKYKFKTLYIIGKEKQALGVATKKTTDAQTNNVHLLYCYSIEGSNNLDEMIFGLYDKSGKVILLNSESKIDSEIKMYLYNEIYEIRNKDNFYKGKDIDIMKINEKPDYKNYFKKHIG